MDDLKTCLSSGETFVFGISVYSSFMDATNGIIPMPGAHETLEGGHALLCVGYDDADQTFLFKNSWNTTWGIEGYGKLPLCLYDWPVSL